MNKKISANEFRETLDSHASDLKANPWLAQSIIASETKGETKVKRKWTTSLVIALLIILTLGTVAYGVSHMWRTVNWQGEVTNTDEHIMIEIPEESREQFDKLTEYMNSVPDNEMVGAWIDDGTELTLWNSRRRPMRKTFRNKEDFLEYMSGITTLTAPASFPEGEYEYFLAEVYMFCKETGKYELVEDGENGSIHYARFRVDEDDFVPVEYNVAISMRNGKHYNIWSSLREEMRDAVYLDEGESVEKIQVKGMDEVLLIKNRKDSAENVVSMHRKLDEPVGWKLVYGDNPYREDTGYYSDEYIAIWSNKGADPANLVKMFTGE